jgi:hypothetical protein
MIQDHDLFIRKYLVTQLYNQMRDASGNALYTIMDDQAVNPWVIPDYGGAWVRVITDPNAPFDQLIQADAIKIISTYPILIQTKCGDSDLDRVLNTLLPQEVSIITQAVRVGSQIVIYPIFNSTDSTQDTDVDGNPMDPAAYTFTNNYSVTVESTISQTAQPAKVVPLFVTRASSLPDAASRNTWLASLIASGVPYYTVARTLESGLYYLWQAIPSTLATRPTFYPMALNPVPSPT